MPGTKETDPDAGRIVRLDAFGGIDVEPTDEMRVLDLFEAVGALQELHLGDRAHRHPAVGFQGTGHDGDEVFAHRDFRLLTVGNLRGFRLGVSAAHQHRPEDRRHAKHLPMLPAHLMLLCRTKARIARMDSFCRRNIFAQRPVTGQATLANFALFVLARVLTREGRDVQ